MAPRRSAPLGRRPPGRHRTGKPSVYAHRLGAPVRSASVRCVDQDGAGQVAASGRAGQVGAVQGQVGAVQGQVGAVRAAAAQIGAGQSGAAQVGAAQVCFYSYRTGECFPSHEAIAKAAGCCVETVRQKLRALEAAGIIQTIRRKMVVSFQPGAPRAV